MKAVRIMHVVVWKGEACARSNELPCPDTNTQVLFHPIPVFPTLVLALLSGSCSCTVTFLERALIPTNLGQDFQ